MADNFVDEFKAVKSSNQKHTKKDIDKKKKAKLEVKRIDNRGVTHVPDEENSDSGSKNNDDEEKDEKEEEEEEEEEKQVKNNKKNRKNKSEKANQSSKTNSVMTSPISNLSSPSFANGTDIGFGFDDQNFPEEVKGEEDKDAKRKRLIGLIPTLFVNGCHIRKKLRPRKSNAWDIYVCELDLSDKELVEVLVSEVKRGCGINGCVKEESGEEFVVFTTGDADRIIDHLVKKFKVNRSQIKSHV